MIAVVATSLHSSQPEKEALAAYAATMPRAPGLYASHAAAWSSLWQSGLELSGGRRDAAVAINASLYYLLSSVRHGAAVYLSPGGLGAPFTPSRALHRCGTM